MLIGSLSIAGLVYFYGAVLFSEKWTALRSMHEEFRQLFSVPSGIAVIYSSFLIIGIPLFALVCVGAWLWSSKRYVGNFTSTAIGVIWVLALIIAGATTLHQAQMIMERVSPFSSNPFEFNVTSEIPTPVQYVFKAAIKTEVNNKRGVPTEGYEPYMFLDVFPGLTETDFDGAEASIGHYAIEEGRLVYKPDDSKLMHSAAKAVTDRGLDRLLANVSVRLKVDLAQSGTLTEIMKALVRDPELPFTPPVADGGVVACTMEAKLCPDGSSVGRSGPHCEFAACPKATATVAHICSPEEKQAQACTMEYRPVCGSVAVQCIKAPCPPVSQTFGNGCSACSQSLVTSYTEGACTQ